jgi:hypothetical protein
MRKLAPIGRLNSFQYIRRRPAAITDMMPIH